MDTSDDMVLALVTLGSSVGALARRTHDRCPRAHTTDTPAHRSGNVMPGVSSGPRASPRDERARTGAKVVVVPAEAAVVALALIGVTVSRTEGVKRIEIVVIHRWD